MKLLLAFSCIVLGCLAHPDYSDTWEEFKEKYGKSYHPKEEVFRQSVWNSNIASIISHNAEADNGLHEFSLGENEFADMNSNEITAYFNGLNMQDSSRSSGVPFQSDVRLQDLPDSVDWRENGTVTPVKNQEMCGSCWAFSATGSLEGQHAIKTGKLVSLSEQNLVDCSAKEGNNGCAGGLMDKAFKYVKDNGGIDTEASYPYTAHTGKTCLYNATNSGANLTSWVDIPEGSEMDLQKAVATVGPVSVAIDASQKTFHFYKKGIYHDKTCSSTRLDHGVLVVGYGVGSHIGEDGKPKDFWLVKNSWGETWGLKGYFELARNRKNACGVATAASFPVV